MHIQWFPGHMTKALRMMEENIKLVDVVGYVLDARAPFSCFNPSFEKLTMGKPSLFILNKFDLADKSKVDKWLAYFKKQGKRIFCAEYRRKSPHSLHKLLLFFSQHIFNNFVTVFSDQLNEHSIAH